MDPKGHSGTVYLPRTGSWHRPKLKESELTYRQRDHELQTRERTGVVTMVFRQTDLSAIEFTRVTQICDGVPIEPEVGKERWESRVIIVIRRPYIKGSAGQPRLTSFLSA